MKAYYITSSAFSVQQRQTKTKGKVWDVYFKVISLDGTESQKKLSGYKTKTLANAAYHEWVAENAEYVKVSPVKKKAPEKEVPLVGDLVREYLASLRGVNKDAVIYEKKKFFDNFIEQRWGQSKITDLTADELLKWQDEMTAAINPRTGELYTIKYYDKLRSHLAAFLHWTEKHYHFENHLKDVDRPIRQAVKRDYPGWTHEQAKHFLSVIDDPTWHCFFTFLYFTGRRKGEVFALSPKDITDDAILWNKSVTRKVLDQTKEPYKVTSTKEDKENWLPYSQAVKDALSAYEYDPDADFLFGGSRPLPDKNASNAFARYTKKANLPKIRMHDLRGSMITNLLDRGTNPAIVADLVGDTVEIIMKNYYKRSKAAIAKTVSDFN